MRIYTTPELNITIKRRDGTVVTDLDFEYLIFTIKEGKNRLDKVQDIQLVQVLLQCQTTHG